MHIVEQTVTWLEFVFHLSLLWFASVTLSVHMSKALSPPRSLPCGTLAAQAGRQLLGDSFLYQGEFEKHVLQAAFGSSLFVCLKPFKKNFLRSYVEISTCTLGAIFRKIFLSYLPAAK